MKTNYTCGNCGQPVNVAVDTHRSAEYALEISVQPCRCWSLCACPECAKDLRQAVAVRRAENMGY